MSGYSRILIAALFGMAMATALAGFGAQAWAAGEGEMCAGIAGIKCDKGLWCEHKENSCNTADAAGICIKVPTGKCPIETKASCGCNGKTYPGDCERRKARVQKKMTGACKG